MLISGVVVGIELSFKDNFHTPSKPESSRAQESQKEKSKGIKGKGKSSPENETTKNVVQQKMSKIPKGDLSKGDKTPIKAVHLKGDQLSHKEFQSQITDIAKLLGISKRDIKKAFKEGHLETLVGNELQKKVLLQQQQNSPSLEKDSYIEKVNILSDKLKILYETELNQLHKFVLKISNCTNPIWPNIVRSHEALRTQEHLLDEGSNTFFQRDTFLSQLKDHKGEGFDKLEKEMRGMLTAQDLSNLLIPPPILIKNIHKKVTSLEDGESAWFDASTNKGRHGMVMRLTKHLNNDGASVYDLQYSNTGAGLDNEDFHQKIPGFLNKKTKYQTVALIKDIPLEKLSSDFFTRFDSIAAVGRDPERKTDKSAGQTKEKGQFDEELDTIDQLYVLMRELGTPISLNPKENPNYFSTAQLGGSCVPSSMWAMAKVIVSKDELRELKADARMQSLLHNYTRIKSGWDQSTTAKIMALDQIQWLKGANEKRQQQSPEILSTIEKELLNDLNMLQPEVRITGDNKFKSFIKPKVGTNNEFVLKPVYVKFKKEDDLLHAQVNLKKTKDKIDYSVQSDSNGKFTGIDLNDQSYMLYFSIASGDHQRSYENFKELRNQIELKEKEYSEDRNEIRKLKDEFNDLRVKKFGMDSAIKELFLSSIEQIHIKNIHIKNLSNHLLISNDEISAILNSGSEEERNRLMEKINSEISKSEKEMGSIDGKIDDLMKEINSKVTEESKQKTLQTVNFLIDLSNKLSEVDRTRSGIAKRVALLDLANCLLKYDQYEVKKYDDRDKAIGAMQGAVYEMYDNALMNYAALDVEFYLPKDNMWLDFHKQFKVL